MTLAFRAPRPSSPSIHASCRSATGQSSAFSTAPGSPTPSSSASSCTAIATMRRSGSAGCTTSATSSGLGCHRPQASVEHHSCTVSRRPRSPASDTPRDDGGDQAMSPTRLTVSRPCAPWSDRPTQTATPSCSAGCRSPSSPTCCPGARRRCGRCHRSRRRTGDRVPGDRRGQPARRAHRRQAPRLPCRPAQAGRLARPLRRADPRSGCLAAPSGPRRRGRCQRG